MQRIYRNELREEMESFSRELKKSSRERMEKLERILKSVNIREIIAGYSPVVLSDCYQNTYKKGSKK